MGINSFGRERSPGNDEGGRVYLTTQSAGTAGSTHVLFQRRLRRTTSGQNVKFQSLGENVSVRTCQLQDLTTQRHIGRY